jgi:hypothetical protein
MTDLVWGSDVTPSISRMQDFYPGPTGTFHIDSSRGRGTHAFSVPDRAYGISPMVRKYPFRWIPSGEFVSLQNLVRAKDGTIRLCMYPVSVIDRCDWSSRGEMSASAI